jgi:hypothetical protein
LAQLAKETVSTKTNSGLSTADASFLRTDVTAAAFQCKLLHTILSASLHKELNKLAAGFFEFAWDAHCPSG